MILIKVVTLFVEQRVLLLICHNLIKTQLVEEREIKKRMMVNQEKDNLLVQLR